MEAPVRASLLANRTRLLVTLPSREAHHHASGRLVMPIEKGDVTIPFVGRAAEKIQAAIFPA